MCGTVDGEDWSRKGDKKEGRVVGGRGTVEEQDGSQRRARGGPEGGEKETVGSTKIFPLFCL